MHVTRRISIEACAFGAALLLLAAGLVYWPQVLRAPMATTPVPAVAPAADDPAARALAGWFGPGDVPIDVVVSGLLRSSGQAVAVMAVNGAPPRAYRIGDTVAASATLHAIEPRAVVLRRGGQSLRFSVSDPAAADDPGTGIVPANRQPTGEGGNS